MNIGVVALLCLLLLLIGIVITHLVSYLASNRAISHQNEKLISSLDRIADKLEKAGHYDVEELVRLLQTKRLVDIDQEEFVDAEDKLQKITDRLDELKELIKRENVESHDFSAFQRMGEESIRLFQQEMQDQAFLDVGSEVKDQQLSLFSDEELRKMEIIVDGKEDQEEEVVD